MPRRLAVLVAVLTALVPALQAQPEAPPNVVLILADDLGWFDLASYGHPFHETPHLDRLAAQGVRFTDAYAAASICSPTRAALLTGRSPAALGLTDFIPGRQNRRDPDPGNRVLPPPFLQELPLAMTTLAEHLQAAGYATASIGKWHLGGDGFEPETQGFDVGLGDSHLGYPPSYFAPYTLRDYALEDLNATAEPGEYLTSRLTDEAVTFIDEQAEAERPFFLYLSHYAVHTPLQPREDLLAYYQAKAAESRYPFANPWYAALLHSLDESVGRVLDALDVHNLADRTFVIFASDNGGLAVPEGYHTPATLNGPLRAGKGYLYEGGIRVPLLIRGPGIAAGDTTAVPTITQDLFNTILDAAGVDVPAESDGHSLLPLLTGGAAPEREALYWHYPHYSNQGGRPGGAVRAGRWKLVEHFEDGRTELFDLHEDPSETKNMLYFQPETAARLRALLHGWREAVGASMPTVRLE